MHCDRLHRTYVRSAAAPLTDPGAGSIESRAARGALGYASKLPSNARNSEVEPPNRGSWSSFGQVARTKHGEGRRCCTAAIRMVDTGGEPWRKATKLLA